MLEDETKVAASVLPIDGYSYPRDLAMFVSERWTGLSDLKSTVNRHLDAATLEEFFAVCYHASLLREEERPVTFRAVLAQPTLFTPDERPPEGLQRLEFSRPIPFLPNELRRLSVASDPHRTLIGVQREGESGSGIWGLINSGTRWMRDVHGGRRAGAPLPSVLVVHVEGPGSVEVYRGHELIAKLDGGRITGSRANPFDSEWLPAQFSRFREELMGRHEAARKRALELSGEKWALLEPTLPRRISERMMKRVISLLRDARHGGTIVFLPGGDEPSPDDPYIDLKYRFADGRRLWFPDLVVDILNRLARLHGGSAHLASGPVGWREFEETTEEEIATLDEALFETSHLIAGLAAADGVVAMSQLHELLGFGGMISGRLPPVKRVARALDLEGETVAEEVTGNVGARHRSAYRLVGTLPGSVAIVVSQDGGVRFVCQKAGRVTYWEHD